MVNSATLDKFYKSNGKNQEDVDIFKEKFLGASSFDDLLAVSRDYLKSGSNIPVCAKTGGLGHLATKRLFDNCGDNCLNENVFAELYTDTNYKQGVFDQFLNDKCLLFVAESAHMINLYKILTDGVEKKIFT